jgi:hypothetical protein
MKKTYLLALAVLFNVAAIAQSYDWIQTTLEVNYAADGVTEAGRFETDYDSDGKEIGYRYFLEGNLYIERRDYQYNGKTATIWVDTYNGGVLQSTRKAEITYIHSNWIQTTQYIIYDLDGVTEFNRSQYVYDSQGRTVGYKYFVNGALIWDYRDYQYNGRTANYFSDHYSGGNVSSSNKSIITYGQNNWIQIEEAVDYDSDGVTAISRTEKNYDGDGRLLRHKYYLNGQLYWDYHDYQYAGRTAQYVADFYPINGGAVDSYNRSVTYSTNYDPNNIHELQANTLTTYPNPFTNTLTIQTTNQTPELVKLISITGKEVLRSSSFTGQLNTAAVEPGMYFLVVEYATGTQVQKVVKQ